MNLRGDFSDVPSVQFTPFGTSSQSSFIVKERNAIHLIIFRELEWAIKTLMSLEIPKVCVVDRCGCKHVC
jgi:hypothetical protein